MKFFIRCPAWCRVPTWETIRRIGELPMLGRASFFAIVFVPIVVGIWPAVRAAVGAYDDVLRRVSVVLCKTSETVACGVEDLRQLTVELAQQADEVGLHRQATELDRAMKVVRGQSRNLRHALARIREDLRAQSLPSPKLPSVWVCGYFGALFVLMGHWSYHAGAPEKVRKFTRAEYAIEARKDRRATTATTEEVNQAGREADDDYDRLAREALWLRLLSGLCYLVGIVCILVMVLLQARAVVRAAGG
ncbi:MAG: hypothetical protein GXP27_21275 [Planctomycetes bacterium]|nr:hypothetical protein [Planctomycetota bacterium]